MPKTHTNLWFSYTFANNAATGWSISCSAAALFHVSGTLNGPSNRYFVGGNRYIVAKSLYCRPFPLGIREFSLKDWVFRYIIGCAKQNPPILVKENRRVSHGFHEVKQEAFLTLRQRTPPCEKGTLLISQLRWVNLISEELRQGNAKRSAYRLQGWQCWRVVSIKHICNCGVGKAGLFCKPIICPPS